MSLEHCLQDIDKYVNDLKMQLDYSQEKHGIRVFLMHNESYGLEIFLEHNSWIKLCGIYREYKAEIHGEYDKEKQWLDRHFKYWFHYMGNMYYCLMTGREAISLGCVLPAAIEES